MRYWTAEMERADALLFGRVTYEMMESAWRKPATDTWPDWMDEWQIPFAETIQGSVQELSGVMREFRDAVLAAFPDRFKNAQTAGVDFATQVRDRYNDVLDAVKLALPQARINGVTIQPMSGKKRGREIYIGLTTDVPFGPVITFGAGGTMIELINDRAMELPPLNQFLAHRLIDRARVAETLGEWRGASAVNVQALEQVLLRVSEMVCELPQLREMDINPIIVDENGAVAVDARIVIDQAPGSVRGSVGDYSHLAILPYPAHHEQVWPLRGGGQYTIRPIRPDDAHMLQALVKSLSPESRYFRFVSSLTELPPSMLSRFTLIDYDREMALVAVQTTRTPGEDGEFVWDDGSKVGT